MSEYHVCEVEFKDEQTLVDALKEMGFQPEVHKTAEALRSNYLRGKEVKGNIIVRKSQHGGYGDIGFERQDNGKYKMHYDNMDVGERRKMSLNKLKVAYAECAIKKKVNSTTRYNWLSRNVEKDGRIHVQLRRRG